jgi:outer membrane protein insertion porin family
MAGKRVSFAKPLRVAAVLLAVGVTALAPAIAQEAEETPAEFRVTGSGWLKNRELNRLLDLLIGDRAGTTLRATAIEDAVLILLSDLRDDGFLEPVVHADLTLADGSTASYSWDALLATSLPRPLEVRRALFRVEPGIRYFYRELLFSGLTAIDEEDARGLFYNEGFLIPTRYTRIYTPQRFERSMAGLAEELRRLGYADVRVVAQSLERNRESGEIAAAVKVDQGPRWIIREVRVNTTSPVTLPEEYRIEDLIGQPYSRMAQQDVARGIRNFLYNRGFPDATVTAEVELGPVIEGERLVDIVATAETGPLITLGEVRIEGAERTNLDVLRRRVDAQSGELLNRIDLERGRFRISRLGVFDTVNLTLEEAEGEEGTRHAVYRVQEGERWDLGLLFGYGSYEQFRVGADYRLNNVFGRAHQARVEAVQSLRSTNLNLIYSVPEIFGELVDGTATIYGLRRDEVAFTRQEYGVTVGLQRRFTGLDTDVGLRYNFGRLEALRGEFSGEQLTRRDARVGSLELRISRDKRDNPLVPRDGLRLFGAVEYASALLGGQVEYQRLELGGAYHMAVGRARWVNLGMTHGLITTLGGDDRDLPANRRFFPGGENSVRGYQRGEAAPRGADGRFIGAKTYTLVNLEFEQALAPNLTVVAFSDAVGLSTRLGDYPFQEALVSAGLGLRYQTIVGPVRLEYGHNLNPRELDPRGTLHFSVGFPF